MTKANPDTEMSVSPRRPNSQSQRTKRFQKLPRQNLFPMFLIISPSWVRMITPQATRLKKVSPPPMRKASATLRKRTSTPSRMRQMMTSTLKITSDLRPNWKPKRPRSVSWRATWSLPLSRSRTTTIGPPVMRKTMKVRTKRSSRRSRRSEVAPLPRRPTRRDRGSRRT